MKTEIAVIGGGAAGLMAALTAAQALHAQGKNPAVLLLEGNKKVGKKLLATGNGRCNLTNMKMSADDFHGDRQEIEEIMTACPPEKIVAAFEKIGLLCRSDSAGRVYPYNLQAAAVLDALRKACEAQGVTIHCESNVEHIVPAKGGFQIRVQSGAVFYAAKLILATGGKASPKHSCGQNGYQLAGSLGHSVVQCVPALVQVQCKEPMIRALKGMRSKVRATLFYGEEQLYAESGETLFSEQGLSGICMFNLSSFLGRSAGSGGYKIMLDFAENMSREEILAYFYSLQQNTPYLVCGDMLSGFLNIKIGMEMIKSLRWDSTLPVGALTPFQLAQLADRIKGLPFVVTGLAGWENAQITAGGVPLTEVVPATMQSKLCPGCYLAGELLNANGQCGGFNLHFAWATGRTAGKSAAVQNG